MKEKYFALNLLILLNYINQISTDNNILIPLYYTYKNNSINNYIEFLLQPQIYAKLKMGLYNHIIYLLISTDTTYFSIESKYLNKKIYDINKSLTFINTTKYISFYNDIYKFCYICQDQFYFINNINNMYEKSYKNISFYYIDELSYEYNKKLEKIFIDKNNNKLNGIIGLKLPDSFSASNNILKTLFNIKAITNNIWSLYFTNSKLFLILGKDPYKDEYNYNEVKRTSCYGSGYYTYWYFLFNDIMVGNIKLNNERIAEYSPQIGVIIGVKEYKNYLKNNFFKNLLENKICNEEILTLNNIIYNYFICDNNINLDNFEAIYFIHEEFSYNFVLDKNDLFIDYNQKKIFLCIFKGFDNTKHWILGLPFIKKYNFVFDQDTKSILFYDKNIRHNNYKNKDSRTIYWIIVILLLVFSSLLFIYLMIKIKIKPKQIKANELEESFRYNNKEDMKEKDILDSVSHSKYNKLGI